MLPKNTNDIRFTSASQMNRRVMIMKPGTGADDEGTPNALELLAANVPARIKSLTKTGRPDIVQQLTQAVSYYEVTIRYRSDFTPDCTIIGPGGQTWAVTSIDDTDFAHVELQIIVREINGGQG